MLAMIMVGVVALAIAAAVLFPWLQLRPEVGTHQHDGLQSMVNDLHNAQTSVLIMCGECNVDRANPDHLAQLEKELIRMRDASVQAVLVLEATTAVPTFVKQMVADKAVRLVQVDRSLPFYGRVVDARVVETHSNDGMYPHGSYARWEIPRIADAYLDSAATVVPDIRGMLTPRNEAPRRRSTDVGFAEMATA